ncbi:MAG: hypothetical protein Q8O37_08695 [Sulfuricellaceae bacterium]|nr:hypothetical protein [Sulfuricellaceae bacterium]
MSAVDSSLARIQTEQEHATTGGPYPSFPPLRPRVHGIEPGKCDTGTVTTGKTYSMTREQILQAFDRIRVWQQGDKRAPHKPLLVLLALGRLQRGEAPVMEFSQIDASLKTLIDEFGPSGAGQNRHLPFWHLATDEAGGLWQLTGPANILERARGATPSLMELRQHHIAGGFSPAVQAALQHDPGLLQEVARRILNAHFPETLHADILAAVGLNLMETGKARSESGEYNRRYRDPGFRERVLRAYEYRCCVCVRSAPGATDHRPGSRPHQMVPGRRAGCGKQRPGPVRAAPQDLRSGCLHHPARQLQAGVQPAGGRQRNNQARLAGAAWQSVPLPAKR